MFNSRGIYLMMSNFRSTGDCDGSHAPAWEHRSWTLRVPVVSTAA
jgi:hypothetical protein